MRSAGPTGGTTAAAGPGAGRGRHAGRRQQERAVRCRSGGTGLGSAGRGSFRQQLCWQPAAKARPARRRWKSRRRITATLRGGRRVRTLPHRGGSGNPALILRHRHPPTLLDLRRTAKIRVVRGGGLTGCATCTRSSDVGKPDASTPSASATPRSTHARARIAASPPGPHPSWSPPCWSASRCRAVVVLVYDVPAMTRAARAAAVAGRRGGLRGALRPVPVLGTVPAPWVRRCTCRLGWLASRPRARRSHWAQWPGWAHGLPARVDRRLAGARPARPGTPWRRTTRSSPRCWRGAVAWAFVVAEPAVHARRVLRAPVWRWASSAWAWRRLFRPLFEIRSNRRSGSCTGSAAAGRGWPTSRAPARASIIANHACWLDPLFLAKVLPRPITPMMTGRFYDLPVIRRLMVAFGVIRVPEKAIRRTRRRSEEAVAALDRGECVVIFPEGYLRRTRGTCRCAGSVRASGRSSRPGRTRRCSRAGSRAAGVATRRTSTARRRRTSRSRTSAGRSASACRVRRSSRQGCWPNTFARESI